MERYLGLLCNKETPLKTVYKGRFYDDAYGNPKWIPQYDSVTECCGTEDWEEIKEEE